jgi:hypothetical protein
LKDVIDAILLGLEAAILPGPDQLLFARSFGGPFEGQAAIAGEALDPLLIVAGALAQNILGEFRLAADLLEKIDHLVFAQQAQQVAGDDDAVKTMINPLQIGSKKFKKEWHRRFPSGLAAWSLV